jgi:hypothetical protein
MMNSSRKKNGSLDNDHNKLFNREQMMPKDEIQRIRDQVREELKEELKNQIRKEMID